MLAKEILAAKKTFHLPGEEDLILQSVPLPSGVIGAPSSPITLVRMFLMYFPHKRFMGLLSNTPFLMLCVYVHLYVQICQFWFGSKEQKYHISGIMLVSVVFLTYSFTGERPLCMHTSLFFAALSSLTLYISFCFYDHPVQVILTLHSGDIQSQIEFLSGVTNIKNISKGFVISQPPVLWSQTKLDQYFRPKTHCE